MTVRILDIGAGADGGTAKQLFEHIEDKKITTVDIDEANKPDIVHDIAVPFPDDMREKYDIVLASHVVEHLDRAKVIGAFRNMAAVVADHGELWVLTPDIEWAAQEIVARRDGIHIQASIFGMQGDVWDYHRCGFTLRALRETIEAIGLVTKKAYRAKYEITSEKGSSFQCIQAVVIGAKFKEMQLSASDALS